MHLRNLALVGILSVVGISGTCSIASAQTQPAVGTAPQHIRGEKGSAKNLHRVEKGIARQIRALENDQRDYAGHRVAAINALKQADAEILAAIAADPH